MPSFFNPARLEDFDAGLFASQRDETYRVIGEATITMTPYKNQKPKRIIFLQPSCLPSVRYAVIVPEGVTLGDSITFIQRKTKQEKQRVRMNLTKQKERNGGYPMYRHPQRGYGFFYKSLLYEKVGKEWVLIEVDNHLLE